LLRMLTAGESHGPACTVIIEGVPAGLSVSAADINLDLRRRHSDFGRGGRGKIEADTVEILSGIRYGKTLGSPITLMVTNRDFDNWREVMNVAETTAETPPLTCPRPGHADLAGAVKYGQNDIRNILERASARETVCRVMAGAVTRRLLAELGICIASHTTRIGDVAAPGTYRDFDEVAGIFERDPDIRCLDKDASAKMKEAIASVRQSGDTLGGTVQVIATGMPAGLGSVMHYDRRLDSRLAAALMSIPSVKGVTIGNAIEMAAARGSEVIDEMFVANDGGYRRRNNNSGGVEGGISNGEDIVLNAYFKPLATLGEPAASIDIGTGKPAKAISERSDVCAVPRAGAVAEAMTAFTLAEAILEKFGGDNISETQRNYRGFQDALAAGE
jgi:chorismate synthase